jgi:D-ribose pyranase
MPVSEILHPQINDLLDRIQPGDTIVIADRNFPACPEIATIELSLTNNIPRVTDVLSALAPSMSIGRIWLAEEFRLRNPAAARQEMDGLLRGFRLGWESGATLRQRASSATCLLRTADSLTCSCLIVEASDDGDRPQYSACTRVEEPWLGSRTGLKELQQ